MSREKDEYVKLLNQILMVQNISWELLPEHQLKTLAEAFEKLRQDVEEFFQLLDEVPSIIPDKGEWRRYTT